ncbi:MAG: nucleoside phosphorylase [Prolixibacteraceae bacterium]|jgi:uridine phosphorylase|nr:nucleoside phosphorylase [Prolixibacteraceae bacterium]
MIQSSELIINSDGSIFHLHLSPEQIADDIILVGDPGRVDLIASFMDHTEFRVQNREFVSVTGSFQGKRISVVSTGIGTDNIDIVLNELDALANIDIEKREIKPVHRTLNFIRIGTSGGLQNDIPVNSFVISRKAVGFDGLLNFYAGRNQVSDPAFENALKTHLNWNPLLASPYVVNCSETLFNKLHSETTYDGVTVSAPGFYGPQGRVLRLPLADPDINSMIGSFSFEGQRITNYEMECSAIYGLSALLGHHALTVCVIIANRVVKNAGGNYHNAIEQLIKFVLDRISQ